MSAPTTDKKSKRKAPDGEDKEDHFNPDTTTTLFVSNLPYSATTTDLTTHFSDIGPVRSAFVVLDKESKKSKGVGYVAYAMREDAERAVQEMNGGSFGDGKGRRLGVEFAGKRPAAYDPESGEAPAPKIKKPRPALPSMTHIEGDAPTPCSNAGPSDPNAIRTLIVSNLPADLTKAVLWKRIRKVPDVEDLIFPVSEEDKTIAHVVFPNAKIASESILRLHAHTYKGNSLSCVLKKRIDKLEAAAKDGNSLVSKGSRLIVRNLPWDTTTQTLHSLFLPFGPIHSITLPPPLPPLASASTSTDPPKPRARGFGFVWMITRKEAEAALEGVNGKTVVGENGKEEAGRVVAVDWALSKDKWKEAESKAAEAAPAAEEIEEAEESDEEEGSSDEEAEGAGETVEEAAPEPVKPVLPPPEEGTTLFIRNLSFEATEDQLRTLFRTYGPLRYAKITMDRATGRSRGSGFVCFWKKEDAEKAVEQARLLNMETGSGANSVPIRNKAANPFSAPSILTVDPSSSLAANLVMHGRVLDVEFAVTREQASKLKEDSERAREKVDKRNTYLMREGVIFPNTPAASTLTAVELERRLESFSSRKTLLTSNPSLYISKTRLSIRQLPLFCTDRTLKRLAIHAAREFDSEVAAGTREGLDEDESRDGTLSPAVAKSEEKGSKRKYNKKERVTAVIQAKIVRATDKVDALTGAGKAKGYGFLEMRTHQDALKVLRWANNNPTVEGLMRDWWAVEIDELVERVKVQVQEARLEELQGSASSSTPAPMNAKAKARAAAAAAAHSESEVDSSDEDDEPAAKASAKKGKGKADAEPLRKKEKPELADLEARLRRLIEKQKELKEAIAAARPVIMKKTLLIEFSVENVQVVQRRVSKVASSSAHHSSNPSNPTSFKRKRDAADREAAAAEKAQEKDAGTSTYTDRKGIKRVSKRPKREDGAGDAASAKPAAGGDGERQGRQGGDRKGGRDGAQGKGSLGLLIGKKRRERKEKRT